MATSLRTSTRLHCMSSPVLRCLTVHGYTVLVCNSPYIGVFTIGPLEKSAKMLHGRFVHVNNTLTDLKILGCGLHQKEDPLGEL